MPASFIELDTDIPSARTLCRGTLKRMREPEKCASYNAPEYRTELLCGTSLLRGAKYGVIDDADDAKITKVHETIVRAHQESASVRAATRLCSVPTCTKNTRERGFCAAHAQRIVRPLNAKRRRLHAALCVQREDSARLHAYYDGSALQHHADKVASGMASLYYLNNPQSTQTVCFS